MIANVYIDPTDTPIDGDTVSRHLANELSKRGMSPAAALLAIEVTVRPDTRFVGRRPLLVLDGGALYAGREAS